jgi:hypothetical protein
MRMDYAGTAIGALALATAISLSASTAKGQAAAEYTIGVSKSAAGAAGVGNTLGQSLSKAAGKVSGQIQTQTETHTSPREVMKDNRAALERSAGATGGVLRLTSDPDDAAIFVDGRLTARTPADIKVPAGKHVVRVTRPDRDPWNKQVTVSKGQTLELRPELVNTNPSVLSLDFPKK